MNLFNFKSPIENTPYSMNFMQKDMTPNNMNLLLSNNYNYSPIILNKLIPQQKDNIDFTYMTNFPNNQ